MSYWISLTAKELDIFLNHIKILKIRSILQKKDPSSRDSLPNVEVNDLGFLGVSFGRKSKGFRMMDKHDSKCPLVHAKNLDFLILFRTLLRVWYLCLLYLKVPFNID